MALRTAPTLPARFVDRRRNRGLTLVEMMVGLVLLSVVLAIAAPSFTQFGRSTRLTMQTGDLQSAFAYARTESMRRGVRVAVCRSANPMAATPSCDGTASWADGWLVFVDNAHLDGNVAGRADGPDTVIRIGEPALNAVITARGTLGPWVSFSPQGLVRTDAGPVGGGLLVCQAARGRFVSLNAVGLVTVTDEDC